MVGVAIMSAISALSAERAQLRKRREMTLENVNLMERQLLIMKNSVEATQEAILDLKSVIKRDREKLDKLNERWEAVNELFAALHVVSSMLEIHKADMAKLESIYNGHIKEQLFRIIDGEDYINQINMLNSSLPEQLSLPPFEAYDLINLCKIYSATNSSHVNIIVRIPVVNSKFFELNEIIPIPISSNNHTILVGINSTHYIRDGADDIQILSMNAFSDCYSFLNVIICNSLIKESFFKPEDCLEQLINEKPVNFCKYKRIKKRNHIIKISKTQL